MMQLVTMAVIAYRRYSIDSEEVLVVLKVKII